MDGRWKNRLFRDEYTALSGSPDHLPHGALWRRTRGIGMRTQLLIGLLTLVLATTTIAAPVMPVAANQFPPQNPQCSPNNGGKDDGHEPKKKGGHRGQEGGRHGQEGGRTTRCSLGQLRPAMRSAGTTLKTS